MERICVMGLGNLLWADEGFGVRAAEQLYAACRLPERVQVIDGGTQGLALLPWVEEADALLLFDAVDFGLSPGALRVFHDDAVPAYLSAKKLSLHQTGFSEVLGLAQLMGRYPRAVALIGVQPLVLEDFGGSLSPPVRAQLAPAVEQALAILASWGVEAQRRAQPQALNPASLSLTHYEGQRPSAQAACRIGDERVLAGFKREGER